MKIKKIFSKFFGLSGPQYKEVDGVRYYTIDNHVARVEIEEETGFYVGYFEEMRAMSCFYAFYEVDIPANGAEALKTYLNHCNLYNINPYKE
ncbi:hypothetical protein C1Y41_04520 [Pantoea sp. ICBG 1758]|uniref:hypothetical protein n=1 Tax=Pantoea sp. ICBG 1758 TaxID=2071682 RepID=UPI000CE52FA2|nr:hypothetical protein [Pantoea sp. ICBG 1758]PPC63914.1 hypothetical protein C1Y41_04520 [Pantoea sp. ICBG 1758]